MNIKRRLSRLEEQVRHRPDDTRAVLVGTIRRRLMRRAEAPDSSVASRVAEALAEGRPGHAAAILTSHMNR